MANTDILAPGADGPALSAAFDRVSPVKKFRAARLAATPEVAMGSPPTPTWLGNTYSASSAVSAVNVNSIGNIAVGALFHVQGGELKLSETNGYKCASVDVASSGAYCQEGWSVNFRTASRYISIGMRLYKQDIRICVDGQYLSLTNHQMGFSDGRYGSVNVDLGSDSFTTRKISVEFPYEAVVFGVYAGAFHAIRAARPSVPRLLIKGDSFVEGTGALRYGGSASLRNAFPQKGARKLGVIDNAIISGWGGTGVLNNGTTKKTFAQLLDDVTRFGPDGVIIFGGVNDGTGAWNATQIQAAYTAYFQSLRDALPTIPIAFMGPEWCPSAQLSSTYKNALIAGIQAVPSIYIHDIYPGGAYQFMTGVTYNETGTQDGRNYWIVGSDGIHPSQKGHDMLGNELAECWDRCLDFHAALMP